jgi:midasin (ATPase involved in ribosome maturation)
MPKAKSSSSTQVAESRSKSAVRKAGENQSSASAPRKRDRLLKVMHKGLGPHEQGAIINESILGDRQNVHRLFELGAVELHVPAPEPEPELDDDLDDDDLEIGDEDETEDDEESDEESDESEDAEQKEPAASASFKSASPLLTKVVSPISKTGGEATASASPKA